MFKFSALFCCLCLSSILLAQDGIQTKNDLGVEDLIRDVFIKGNCRNVSNITSIGDEILSIGQFDNGGDIIGINNGIILSTGDIDLAHGPNVDNESGYFFNLESNDPDLSQLATDTLFDVTGIEFDFIPISDKVTFRYVFASEEYCEFVTTSFNDVFGFFVSGSGINGTFDNNAINVATLNDSGESVSINTVNHLDNEDLYISNITTIDAENCDVSYNPTYQNLIEYDGFTIPLTASFDVIPCETYHIRLILGDVGDANLDSAVFLESKSFDLGEKVNIRAEVPGRTDPIAYESCVDGQFVFTRSSLTSINQACTIEYTISEESTATSGVDFLDIPLSVTIPAGDTNFILPITLIEDNVVEGAESIKLAFEYECDCIDPSLTELIINDPPSELSANFEEIEVCENQTFSITPEIIGGLAPYDFLWSTGTTTQTLERSVTAPTTYTVAVTDFCGNTSSAIANIDIQNAPTATLVGDYDLCETTETGIPVVLEGNPPWNIAYTIDDVEQEPIENIQSNPFYLNTPSAGIYSLVSFNDTYCDGNVFGSAAVEYNTFELELAIISPSCFNRSDGSIAITNLEAIAPFAIEWNIETEDDYFIENLAADTYTLSILDANDCVYEKSFDLNAVSNDINDCVPIYIPNSFSPNDDGVNDGFSIFFDEPSGIENVISLQVYDRWGALVFEQRNFMPIDGATDWKGEYNDTPLNAGIYVYKIMVGFEDGSTLLLSGDVVLLR